MKRQYRIVTDAYAGFEVQWRTLGFWLQRAINTHPSIEKAHEYAQNRYARIPRVKRQVVDRGEVL